VRYLSRETGLSVSDLRVAAVLIFVILNLAVFFRALRQCLALWRTVSLRQSPGDLSVWKAVHHLSVYEWPLSYPFSLSLYNYLFYETYAFFLRQVGVAGAGIMMWGRFLTPVFPVIGAIANGNLVQYHLNLRGARSVLSLFFAVGLWFCTSNRPPLGALHTA